MKSILWTPLLTVLAALVFTLPVNAADATGRRQSLIADTIAERDVEPVTYRNRRWHRHHHNRYRGDRYYYGGNNYYDRPYYGRNYGYGFGGPGLFLNFGGLGGYGYRNRGYSTYGDGYGYGYDRRWR
jgi:hypothetical protein